MSQRRIQQKVRAEQRSYIEEIPRKRFQMKVHPVKEDTSDSDSTSSDSSTESEKTDHYVGDERECTDFPAEEVIRMDPVINSEDDKKDGKTDLELHYAAMKGKTGDVHQLLSKEPNLKAEDENKRIALHHAIKNVKVVHKLLEKRSEVNKKDKFGRTPLSYAAEEGMLESVIMLLKYEADKNSEDDKKMRPIHYAAAKGHWEVFLELAENNSEQILESELNCLDLAIDNGHEETALAIFQISKLVWKEMMRSRSRRDGNSFDTPMRRLIRKMPNVAREVFTLCTEIKNNNPFEVEFCYEFLDDTYHLDDWKISKQQISENKGQNEVDIKENDDAVDTNKNTYLKNTKFIEENHPLMIMVKSKRTELLDHPLVAALLKRKWKNIGLIFSIFNFLLYATFLGFLTGFALDVRAPYQFQNASSYTSLECPDFTEESIPTFASYARYGVYALASIELIIELFEITQMFSCKVWLYFLEIENVLEWITCITAILFVTNTSGCNDTGYRTQWQWTCGTISVFLAWINMLFIIRKFEWFGIYVVMLYRVVKMFMKFFLVFSLLIIAFAVSFHCLFQNQDHFKTIGISLMKTTSMMIGGPDFVTTFLDETVHYETISYAFFYVFMLFMAIVVFNLLVGLAVSNIQEFQKKAEISKKKMQVKFALNLERIATSRILLKNFVINRLRKEKKTEVLRPSDQSWLEMKFSESWKLTERHIKAAMKTQKDDSSRVIAQLDAKLKTLETKLETYIEKKLKKFWRQKVKKAEKNEIVVCQ